MWCKTQSECLLGSDVLSYSQSAEYQMFHRVTDSQKYPILISLWLQTINILRKTWHAGYSRRGLLIKLPQNNHFDLGRAHVVFVCTDGFVAWNNGLKYIWLDWLKFMLYKCKNWFLPNLNSWNLSAMHEHKLKYLNSVMMLYFNISREKHKILTQNTQVFLLFFLRVLLWSAF